MLASSDSGVILFAFLFKAVFGGICAAIAGGRGRSAVGWFFIGLLFDCFALILLLVLPDLRRQEETVRRTELENRRLREQLAKERQVADQRHGHVERRLGAHDEALGLDTSQPPQLAAAAEAPPALPGGKQWFYARGQERLGPVSEETVRHLLQARAIDGKTLVWCAGMANWLEARLTSEFQGDAA